MGKTRLFLLVAVLAVLVAQPLFADDWRDVSAEVSRHRHQAEHSLMNPQNSGHYYYSPAADLRDAHRAYWDEGLVDEVGKVITLPFTLPMRVKSEWERLNTKATHWKKVREAYERDLPSQEKP